MMVGRQMERHKQIVQFRKWAPYKHWRFISTMLQ